MKSDIETQLAKYGVSKETYCDVMEDIIDKLNGDNGMEWVDIVDKYDLPISPDTLRKANGTIFGGKFVAEFIEHFNGIRNDGDDKLTELRKERMKLQTLNVERNRLDRSLYRQELFYEYVGQMIQALPVPEYHSAKNENIAERYNMEYCLCLADIHYGAKFKSENNEYSPEIVKERFGYLLGEVINFVREKKLNHFNIVNLSDNIQGLLRISDLKLNDSTVVQSVVEISRLIAWFLNELSAYVIIDYYATPTANHSQNRVIGAKASELAFEDMEYIIDNYIKDLLRDNGRVCIHLADEGKQYISFNLFDYLIVCMHGHTIKGLNDSVKRISTLHKKFVTTLLIGHQHSGKELTSHALGDTDAEVIVAPAFVGSDNYAEGLMLDAKAACGIYGYSECGGHVESYKIILN